MPRPAAHLPLLLLLLAFLAPVANAQPQTPTWALEQNSPNPFCPLLGSTAVPFEMSRQAHMVLRVWSPDSAMVVRTLVDRDFQAGPRQVAWDGKDDSGTTLASGDYPITMIAESDSAAPRAGAVPGAAHAGRERARDAGGGRPLTVHDAFCPRPSDAAPSWR